MAFYTPAFNLERWKMMLPDPEKRWEDNGPVQRLARAWANAKDLPPKVRETFERCGDDQLRELKMLLKIPEHPVALDDADHPAMNDLFVLARSDSSLFTIMVAGAGNESFGPTVAEWQEGDGTAKRLDVLMETLALRKREALNAIRVEWLLRAASAVVEAKRYHAGHAMLLVHSFGDDDAPFGEFADFLGLYGLKAEINAMAAVQVNGVTLHLGWVSA